MLMRMIAGSYRFHACVFSSSRQALGDSRRRQPPMYCANVARFCDRGETYTSILVQHFPPDAPPASENLLRDESA
jgi:hypothetical protein